MLALVLLLAASPAAQPDRTMAYLNCLDERARAYEVSAEPAHDVAAAAMGACMQLQHDRENELRATLSGSDAEVEREIGQQRQMFDAIAIRKVVEIRACRKTPGCKAP